jgi:hypothetical protein
MQNLKMRKRYKVPLRESSPKLARGQCCDELLGDDSVVHYLFYVYIFLWFIT